MKRKKKNKTASVKLRTFSVFLSDVFCFIVVGQKVLRLRLSSLIVHFHFLPVNCAPEEGCLSERTTCVTNQHFLSFFFRFAKSRICCGGNITSWVPDDLLQVTFVDESIWIVAASTVDSSRPKKCGDWRAAVQEANMMGNCVCLLPVVLFLLFISFIIIFLWCGPTWTLIFSERRI